MVCYRNVTHIVFIVAMRLAETFRSSVRPSDYAPAATAEPDISAAERSETAAFAPRAPPSTRAARKEERARRRHGTMSHRGR